MTASVRVETTILKDLGDGLILRRSTPSDAEALAAFNASVHGYDATGEADDRVGAWTRDLLERPHPTFRPGDFTIVEDTNTGAIVSSMNLISQVWSYAGIAFKVGRPELMGSDPPGALASRRPFRRIENLLLSRWR